jgi:hypothetical protein
MAAMAAVVLAKKLGCMVRFLQLIKFHNGGPGR